MNTAEWVKKAEDDLRSAEVLIGIEEPPTWVVCFHCQQSAEKYLKGYIEKHNVGFEKAHDLIYLLGLCLGIDNEFKKIQPHSDALNRYSIAPRYPLDEAVEYAIEEAKGAVENAGIVKEFVNKKLGNQ